MLFYSLLLLSVILIVAEVISAKKNRATRLGNSANEVWNKIYRWRWLVGIPFAVLSTVIYYPISGETESYRIMGFPLMVAAFDEAGRDYVGPFTGPSLFGNAVIWYFLPHLALFAWAKVLSTKRKSA